MAFSLEVDHQAWKETEIRRLTNQYRITGPPSLRPSPLSSFCLLENRVLGKQDDSSLQATKGSRDRFSWTTMQLYYVYVLGTYDQYPCPPGKCIGLNKTRNVPFPHRNTNFTMESFFQVVLWFSRGLSGT